MIVLSRIESVVKEERGICIAELLVNHISIIKDPRMERRKLHRLSDIIVISLCAVLCGCRGWEEIEEFAEDREQWFRTFLSLDNGIPSHDTIERVFQRICPKEFSKYLSTIAYALRQIFSEEVIAIDGKSLRGSFDKSLRQEMIHTVSAYSVQNGLTLAQVKTDDKSNEITAIPELLDLIDVKGGIVTIDAIGCQIKIAEKIISKKGDYLLAVKANQPSLHRQIKGFFEERTLDELDKHPSTSVFEQANKGHGRLEERICVSTSDIAWIEGISKWKDAQSIIMLQSSRTIADKTSVERRYYISSIDPCASSAMEKVRAHWEIENSLHWCLDVTFKEDLSRVRRNHAPENLAIVRRLALNILKQEKTVQRSLVRKGRKAFGDTSYLQKLLGLEENSKFV